MTNECLWEPSAERIAGANVTRYMQWLREHLGLEIADVPTLYQWSIQDIPAFWSSVWDFCGVRAAERGERVVEHFDRMPGASWFPDARLNFAENLLWQDGDHLALVSWSEHGPVGRMTYGEVRRQVAQLAAALRHMGIKRGDRIAGYMPNRAETVIAMLAATSLGAVWSSCSPDFGTAGVVDRFGQIEPRVLFAAKSYLYNGKTFDATDRLRSLAEALPSVERIIIVAADDDRSVAARVPKGVLWDDFLTGDGACLTFEPFPFSHPIYILYSSGTTGKPKCIVHGAGGTLLQHLKELVLHTDLKPENAILYYTTCGWMMWNWLVSSLAVGSTVVLYDGSPLQPHPEILFELADSENLAVFGASAKYFLSLQKVGAAPATHYSLSSLRTILSTGSPLPPDAFDFIYQNIKRDVCLSSISGGTDLISCFVLGNPIGPVYRGEIQTRGLGMKVEVFDDRGESLVGAKGELVCTAPFPSMPIGFWNDPDGAAYRRAYFERYPGAWHHGDYVELTERGGMIIYGRSDAVLNPGGVRIGTAEIYRQVEQLDEILESLVVGQEWDNDIRIVLFVRLREGVAWSEELAEKIRRQIRENTTPRHVPGKIVPVPEIPRTVSGKIVELAVRDLIHGRPVVNREALANPAALEYFRHLPELQR